MVLLTQMQLDLNSTTSSIGRWIWNQVQRQMEASFKLTTVSSGANGIDGRLMQKQRIMLHTLAGEPSNTTSSATYNVSLGTTALVHNDGRNISVGHQNNTEGSNNAVIS